MAKTMTGHARPSTELGRGLSADLRRILVGPVVKAAGPGLADTVTRACDEAGARIEALASQIATAKAVVAAQRARDPQARAADARALAAAEAERLEALARTVDSPELARGYYALAEQTRRGGRA